MINTGWFVIYCSVGCEAKVAEKLTEQGFDAYHAIRIEERRHRRSREVREVPLSLFPRYLFVRQFPLDDHLSWYMIRKTAGVESALLINGRPAVVSAEVLACIREQQSAGQYDSRVVGAAPLKRGQKVRIAEGPFGGHHAVVESAKPGRSIRVLMDIFGRANYAHVPIDHLRLVA